MSRLTAGSTSSLPEYARIKRLIVAQIESGQFEIGRAIPSETHLSQEHKVSRSTVVRSLQELTLEGFLFRRQGLGTFVADFKSRAVADRHRPEIPVFIFEETYRLSSAREVVLRFLSGMEEGLGVGQSTISLRQVPATLDDHTRQLIDQLKPRFAIIIEPSFNTALLGYLQHTGCETWAVNEPLNGTDCAYINQEQAAYLATEHLLKKGRTQIALLNGPVDAYWGFGAKFRGYVNALRAAGISPDPNLHRQAAHSIDSEAGRSMFRSLLDEGAHLDGVVASSDSKAMGAMALASERGLILGHDVSFVCIDDLIADQAELPLTAVALPFGEMGRQVGLRVRDRSPRASGPVVYQQIVLQPYLIERAT